MNIVSSELLGGLGNQLFLIAIVIEYAICYNKIAVFKIKSQEEWEKDHEITAFDTLFKNSNLIALNSEAYNKILFNNIINEKKEYAKNELKEFEGNVLIKGYFQSPYNFSEQTRDFMTNSIYSNLEYFYTAIYIYNQIKEFFNCNDDNDYIFIHIRRGDFVLLNFYVNLDYYKKALDILGNNKKIIIFSDDIEWCKNNIFLNDNQIYVDFINNRYIELILMSLFLNGIVCPESSFSWWGAYIGNKYKKIVCSKLSFNYFEDNKLIDKYEERYLKEWIII